VIDDLTDAEASFQGVQSGAVNRRLPSLERVTPGRSRPCLSHSWQVTDLCF